jgi:hypothetical protein
MYPWIEGEIFTGIQESNSICLIIYLLIICLE